jgi:hypothetical protein
MPATTPKYAFPYPLGTDLIAEGDDAIKALAERVEAVLGPPWIALPFAAGWANIGGAYDLSYYCKVGGFLYVRGNVMASGTSVTICTLPAGYRPVAAQLVSVNYWNGSTLAISQFAVNAAGTITTSWNPASGHNFPIITPPIWVGP